MPYSFFNTLVYYTDPTNNEVVLEFDTLSSFESFIRYTTTVNRQGESPILEISIWGAVVDKEFSQWSGDIKRIENGDFIAKLGIYMPDPKQGRINYFDGRERQEIQYKGILREPVKPYKYEKVNNPPF